MNRFIAATVVAFISVTPAVAADFGDPAKAQPIANQICAACHGADGNSPLPMNPSLAGQLPEYLFKQLIEFKSGNRNNAVMTGMVAALSADDMRNLAAYYATQKPGEPAAKDKDLAAHGRKLFRGGNVVAGVAACAGCHSPNGCRNSVPVSATCRSTSRVRRRAIEGIPCRRARQRRQQHDARGRGPAHRHGNCRRRRVPLRFALTARQFTRPRLSRTPPLPPRWWRSISASP